ncbi:hypothetical protein, partial [Lachnoclostridium sp. Marseille-P6806]|uniref:hypothetical protein n=1 Tax=Lachnoclostridium sp. Marseille-P6806 TaxID=2364793 RepID=UPI003562F0FE
NACGDSRLRGLGSRKPIGFRQWVVHQEGLSRWAGVSLYLSGAAETCRYDYAGCGWTEAG